MFQDKISKAIDKNKLLDFLVQKPDITFLPISRTEELYKAKSEKLTNEEVLTVLNMYAGWVPSKKVFTIPDVILSGFIETFLDSEEYDELKLKDWMIPSYLIESIPYWTNVVKIDKLIRINFVSETNDETTIKFRLKYVIFGIRKEEDKLFIEFVIPNNVFNQEGIEVKDGHSHVFKFQLLETMHKGVYSLVNVSLCDRNHILSMVFTKFCLDVFLYVCSMSRHKPKETNHYSQIKINKLGRVRLPTPKETEILLTTDSIDKIQLISNENGLSIGRGKNSKYKTHIRKGFWRRQWYGPLSSPWERTVKIIFIPPCLVRGFNENV